MKKLLLAMGILALICSPAMAGRNANGAMAVHTNDAVIYSAGWDYCANEPLPPNCLDLNTMTTKAPDAEPAVIWVVGVWDWAGGASPGITAYQFGAYGNYPLGYWEGFAPCGPGALEIPDATWPQSGTGTAVAYTSAVYPTQPVKLYWLAMYGIVGGFFGTGPYPHGDMVAQFADDGNPPAVDNCYNFGTVRWGAPGENQCPIQPETEACCFSDGTCRDLFPQDCAAQGGTPQGAGTNCATVACPVFGACCLPDFSCVVVTAQECAAMGGVYRGDNVPCTPTLCLPPPQGACCIGTDCTITTLEGCPGEWQGEGTVCDPNPCLPVTEACCFADGSCQDLPAADCAAQGGTAQGVGTQCVGVQCPVVATQPTTWGQIKANYR